MIRDFDLGDLESVQKLLSSIPGLPRWSADDFLLASERNVSLRVAEEEGSTCGLVVFRMIADEAEILNLAVDSSRRRRGIGSRLVQETIDACKAAGVKRIFLEVRESNRDARNFYARMRFAEAGRRRDYYRGPIEDALLLQRTVA